MSVVNANSGNPVDVQAAINTVVSAGGGTVQIPTGTFDFNPYQTWTAGQTPTSIIIPWNAHDLNIVGAGIDKTILLNTEHLGGWAFVTQPPASATQPQRVRLSNFNLQGFVTSEAVASVAMYLRCINKFRVDHVKFEDWRNFCVWVDDNTGGTYVFKANGVVDNCIFDNQKVVDRLGSVLDGCYGVAASGRMANGVDVNGNPYPAWEDLSNLVGKFGIVDNTHVYVENCSFNRMRHDVTSSIGAWYVARHNLNMQSVAGVQYDVHGDGYTNYGGARGCELYDNHLIGTGTYAIVWRGGNHFATRNIIENATYAFELWDEQLPLTLPERRLNFMFEWGNTLVNVANLRGGYNDTYTGNQFYQRAPTSADLAQYPTGTTWNGSMWSELPYPFPFEQFDIPNEPVGVDYPRLTLNSNINVPFRVRRL